MSTKKRWVTPSFDSLGTAEAAGPPKKKCGPPRKRILQDKGTRAPYAPTASDRSVTWLEKYQPRTVDELVIHPKKVQEVEDWFRNYATTNSGDKYLVLCGPCGCGKSTTLRVVAKRFNFDVVEWLTPLDRDYHADPQADDRGYQSAGDVFEQFLSRATRYPSLLSTAKSKLVLVKDYPNVFLQNADALHEIVRKYALVHTFPVVFVCNDDFLARTLFPDALRKECNVRTISFNPVHGKAVVKALRRVLELERKSNPAAVRSSADANLEHVCQSCGGDLRSAILKLYFSVAQPPQETRGEKGQKRAPAANVDKDETVDLFKSLGRVLYAKRKRDPPNSGTSGQQGYAFEHDPNAVADAVCVQPATFVAFLQENYASRFSRIRAISRAADELSHADRLLAQYHKDTNTMAVAVAARGLMVANDEPVRSFRPFVRPRKYDDTVTASLRDEVRDAFPEFQHSPEAIILDTLPLMSRTSRAFEESQKRTLNKLLAPFRK